MYVYQNVHASINHFPKFPVKYIGFPKYHPLKGGIIQKLMSSYFTSLVVPIEFIKIFFNLPLASNINLILLSLI